MEEQPNNHSTTIIVDDKKKQEQKTKKQQQDQPPVPFFSLFRFANKTDYILMVVGSIAALAMGAALPAFALLWGQMTDSFNQGGDAMVNASRKVMFEFIYIGIGALVAGWLMFACWMITGQRQAIQCRKDYLRSLLRQQIGWFDMINQSQLSSKFATDSFAFQGAIGQKISTMLMTLGMFIAGFAVAFSTGWLMTLVVLTTIPALGLAGAVYITAISEKDAKSAKDYAKAGGKAQQALAAIKTVKQLNGQAFEQMQYEICLRDVASKALKYGMLSGIGIGLLFFVMLASYSLGFWYGSHCVEGTSSCPPNISGQNYTAGDVLVIFFSILMAGFNLSQVTPAMKKIAQGRQAASRIFKIIDREPLIKNPENGKKPEVFNGIIKFEGVSFAYPKDKERKILNNINLEFNSNSSALVGQSGCGKSTIFQLIMRFYDPDEGRITLDGVDIKELDLIWLKEKIGYVGQQPVLFATTIRQNLLFGKEDATQQEINNALVKAQAFSFVQTLEQKLQTYVGYGGGQLSGGQKQRIAIARALLRNPKILLLDQATSALDRKNERLIQNTLDKISQGRTSITIAHRAKTIMKSDVIYVLDKGKVDEFGKFKELKRFKDVHFQEQDEIKQNDNSPQKHSHNVEKKGRIDFTSMQNIQGEQNKNGVNTDDVFLTKEEKEKKYQQELLKKYEQNIFSRVMSYSNQKKLTFFFGILAAIINGLIFPTFTIFLSKMLNVLIKFTDNPVQARKDSNLYALIFLLLGILAFFVNVIQLTLFSSIGEQITKKIRYQTYGKILKMPIVWFDNPRNNAGSLTARLSSDCNSVNGLTTTFVAITIQNITSLIAGITIGFVFQWRTSLVALGLIPFMIAAGAIQMAFTTGFSEKTDSAYKDSSNLIMEAMLNIRTVSSFGYQNVVYHKYSQKLQEPLAIGIKKGNISGVLFGLSQLVMFIIFALIFFIGTIFIRDAGVTIPDVFTAIYAITFSAMTAGNNSHFLPDIGAAKNSAANLFQILDSQDEDQIQIKEGSKLLKSGISGHFQLKNIQFKYATRNNHVFENFSLQIRKGQKVAFVGHSGCGKSTIFQLLQRFYDPQKGQILIDGINIKDYDIHYLRSCFGVVSQEPVLFNGSFKYNIIYNMPNVKEQQMISAANEANALLFIEGEQKLQSQLDPQQLQILEQKQKAIQGQNSSQTQNRTGFDKSVGVKGSQISGGQKQRVAIARAILRNPSILFLDEATSALDSANQKKVQESLDRIMKSRTTISIAHRIDTIKNCDEINVFDHGRVVEQGKYNQLVSKKGYFYNLQRGTDFL